MEALLEVGLGGSLRAAAGGLEDPPSSLSSSDDQIPFMLRASLMLLLSAPSGTGSGFGWGTYPSGGSTMRQSSESESSEVLGFPAFARVTSRIPSLELESELESLSRIKLCFAAFDARTFPVSIFILFGLGPLRKGRFTELSSEPGVAGSSLRTSFRTTLISIPPRVS